MERQVKGPKFIVEEGKTTAVITDIDEYRELLERLEDAEACAMLERLDREPEEYQNLDEFLAESGLNV